MARRTRGNVRTHRSGRSGVALAVVVTVALLAAGTYGLMRRSAAGDPVTLTDQDVTCTGTGGLNLTQCRVVRTPAGMLVRYAVLRPQVATRSAVLVDLGGPGVSLFGAHWPAEVRQALPDRLRHHNLVLLEEPWVARGYGPACRAAVRAYFDDVRRARANTAAHLWRECGLGGDRWGWRPAAYREAVRSIAAAEFLSVEAFVGVSFGGRRLAYLADAPPPEVVLVDPAPPGRFNGLAYLAERDGEARRHLAIHGCRCADEGAVTRAVRAASRALAQHPVRVPGRSVPVTAADVGPAIVALGYQPAEVIVRGWQAILDPVADAAVIGGLADRAWMRFGIEDVSPAWLAYLDEVCAAFDGWRGLTRAAGRADPVVSFLRDFHAPCAHVGPNSVADEPGVVALRSVCVVVGADGVISAALLAPWRELANVRHVRTGSSLHGDLATADRCEQ